MTIVRQNLYKISRIGLNRLSRSIVAKVLEHITACVPAKHPVVHTSGWGACLGNVPTACALLKYSPHVTATLAAIGHASRRRWRLTQSSAMSIRHRSAWQVSKVNNDGANCCACCNHQIVCRHRLSVIWPNRKLLLKLWNMNESGDCWPACGRTPLE